MKTTTHHDADLGVDIDDTNDTSFVITEPVQGRRVLSGVQPSGRLHLGNYLGAMKQHVQAQQDNECFLFIADLHAITTQRDGAALRRASIDVALDYLALGLDPEKVAFYRQHHVPAVCTLSWILNCFCPVGDLERSTSYKDKVAKGLGANAGLFTYPVLMAADILMLNAEVVPVGQDQLPHIELARRMASRFNQVYGVELFRMPMAQINQARVVPGLDGQKMSKSYGNTIPIFATADEYRRLVAQIQTDGLSVEAAKDPETCNAFSLLALVASPEEAQEWADRYRAGGVRYSAVKSRIVELLLDRFGPAMERRRKLEAAPWMVEDILQAGAAKATQVARSTLERVFDLVGLDSASLGQHGAGHWTPRAPTPARQGWGE